MMPTLYLGHSQPKINALYVGFFSSSSGYTLMIKYPKGKIMWFVNFQMTEGQKNCKLRHRTQEEEQTTFKVDHQILKKKIN